MPTAVDRGPVLEEPAAFIPLATVLPALLSLSLVACAACGLIALEVVHYAEARDRIRHGA